MSFDLLFWINEDVYSEEKYLRFLQECRKIEGDWELAETHSFGTRLCNCYRNEYHTDCYKTHEVNLHGFELIGKKEDKLVSIWIRIYKEREIEVNFDNNEKYKTYVEIETGMSRGFVALAVQFLIPVKAFEFFGEVVVIDELTCNVYFNSTQYLLYVKEKLTKDFIGCESVYQKYFLK